MLNSHLLQFEILPENIHFYINYAKKIKSCHVFLFKFKNFYNKIFSTFLSFFQSYTFAVSNLTITSFFLLLLAKIVLFSFFAKIKQVLTN